MSFTYEKLQNHWVQGESFITQKRSNITTFSPTFLNVRETELFLPLFKAGLYGKNVQTQPRMSTIYILTDHNIFVPEYDPNTEIKSNFPISGLKPGSSGLTTQQLIQLRHR